MAPAPEGPRRSILARDYSEVRSGSGDFLYLDPPYHTDLRFFYGHFDFSRFFDWLGRQRGSDILSLNGEGEGLREITVPKGTLRRMAAH